MTPAIICYIALELAVLCLLLWTSKAICFSLTDLTDSDYKQSFLWFPGQFFNENTDTTKCKTRDSSGSFHCTNICGVPQKKSEHLAAAFS